MMVSIVIMFQIRIIWILFIGLFYLNTEIWYGDKLVNGSSGDSSESS